MRIPERPPELPDPTKIGFNKLIKIVSAVPAPTYKGRYVHWDKLKHLPRPPELKELSHAEWWFGLKTARRFLTRPLPLIDKAQKPFALAIPDPIPEMLHALDKGAGGALLSPELGINHSMRDHYVVRSLTEEAITSSQLEGAATTREVAKQMLRSGRPPRDTSERMILNNYRAMEAIRRRKDDPLTPELILDLHRILSQDTLDRPDAVGRFRSAGEIVRVMDVEGEILHTPPDAESLAGRVQLMCDFANKKIPAHFIHPAIRAIILHFWLAYDHPFVDGNGRCARALFYWSMLNSGYWLCEFISISHIVRKAPIRYGRAFLYTETDDNDLTYFVLYHLDVLKRSVDELHRYIDKKTRDLRQTEQLIQLRQDFNHRQLSLLSHALRHPDALYGIAEHRTSHNIAYETARTDLLSLSRLGLLLESRRGREYYFRPAPDLLDKLQRKSSK